MNTEEASPHPVPGTAADGSATCLSAGKLRALTTLADDDGVFRMVAVDQRPPLFAALARHGDRRPEDLPYAEIEAAKRALVRQLAPVCGAILLDPVWSQPGSIGEVPGRTAIISTLEDYGFDADAAGERRSRPIRGWSVAKAKRSGAAGVKLLAWYRPDASAATLRAQEALIMEVGAACVEHDVPFILEPLVYPLAGEDPESAAYHAARPELVLGSLERLAEPRFGVDLYKLEFPAALRFCEEHRAELGEELRRAAPEGAQQPALYDLDQVHGWLRRLDATCPTPWVLLSAGVGRREFELDLDLAFAAGASGFLAGRTVWLQAFDSYADGYPELDGVERALRADALPYLARLSAAADRALPWTTHRSYGGGPRLADAGEGWHERYPSMEPDA